MRIVYALGAPEQAGSEGLGPAVIAASAFDGVHRQHRRLAERAAALARREAVPAIAVVLWEGSAAVNLESGEPARLLTLLDERLELLDALGLFHAAMVVSRVPDTAPLGPEALLEILGRNLEPRALIWDAGGEAAAEALAALAATRGIAVERVQPDEVQPAEHDAMQTRTLGTRIADLLLAGDVRAAARLLGHPYGVRGEVVSGDRRGRLLGFPTANLRLDARKLLPADGIYAARARLPGERAACYPAVVSLGVRPQFGGGRPRLLEVFLLDAAIDLYGLSLAVELVARLREERRFPDVEALKVQMARDVTLARAVLHDTDDTDGESRSVGTRDGERETRAHASGGR
jgi:riboflavin kinase/FMN adenylyltransferase